MRDSTRSSERGAVLLVAALALLALVALAAFATDAARAVLVKHRQRTACDAAARAALATIWLADGAAVPGGPVPDAEAPAAFAARLARGGPSFADARDTAALVAAANEGEPVPLATVNALGEEALLPVDPDAAPLATPEGPVVPRAAPALDPNEGNDPAGDVWIHRHPAVPVDPSDLLTAPADAAIVRARLAVGVGLMGLLRRGDGAGGSTAVRSIEVEAASLALCVPATEVGVAIDDPERSPLSTLALSEAGFTTVCAAAGAPVTLSLGADAFAVATATALVAVGDALAAGAAPPPEGVVLVCPVVDAATLRVLAFARLVVVSGAGGPAPRVRAVPSAVGSSVAARRALPLAQGAVPGRPRPWGVTCAPARATAPEELPR